MNLAVTIAALLAAASSGTEPAAPFRVHVRVSADAPRYGTREEIAETTAAVRKAMAGMKEFALVDDPAAAEAVLTVVDRKEGGRPGGYLGAQGQVSQGGFDPNRMIERPELWVQAALQAGDSSAEIHASTSASWGASAKEMAKEVRKWLKKNGAKVRSPAGTKGPPPAPPGTPPR